jgi:hypothetical protein
LSVTASSLTITTSSLPNGSRNVAYSATLTASGGKMPYAWSIASGNLPTGLSLGSTGTISGTPTQKGNFSFSVRVTDSSTPAATATKALSIRIR